MDEFSWPTPPVPRARTWHGITSEEFGRRLQAGPPPLPVDVKTFAERITAGDRPADEASYRHFVEQITTPEGGFPR